MHPLIGISTCLDERHRWHPSREYLYLDSAYGRALARAGATPLLLPLQEDAEALVARLDGLLIPGGDDFAPPRPYPADVRFELVPPRQLAFDQALLAAALARRLPLLGICYGMQLLALHAGGTLVYDIPSDLPDAGPHRLAEGDGHHGLVTERGSRLGALLGAEPVVVNSHHHQGVASAGSELRVAARADDGLVEAIEAEGADFCIGVQWHPERMPGPHGEGLFAAFAAACRARAAGRP